MHTLLLPPLPCGQSQPGRLFGRSVGCLGLILLDFRQDSIVDLLLSAGDPHLPEMQQIAGPVQRRAVGGEKIIP